VRSRSHVNGVRIGSAGVQLEYDTDDIVYKQACYHADSEVNLQGPRQLAANRRES
jgi:hypothetical protein